MLLRHALVIQAWRALPRSALQAPCRCLVREPANHTSAHTYVALSRSGAPMGSPARDCSYLPGDAAA
eukprot:12922090-Prorocentrum_lima.AAC.1